MGWSRPDEESRADYFHETRKHDERPGDALPHRLDRPITTAMDIALCVRGMKNILEAAALIEQYAKMQAAVVRAQDAEVRYEALHAQA